MNGLFVAVVVMLIIFVSLPVEEENRSKHREKVS